MGESKKYVVYGMMAKCSEGTMENYISTDTGHGVVYQGQPVLNANDHQKGVNLTHFGDCNSKKIYEEAKKEIDEKYKAEEGDGFFTKLGKGLVKAHMKTAIFVQEHLMFHKCELDTPLPWIFTSKDHMIDGAPALTMESQCACRYGGIITIVPEEEAADVENQANETVDEDIIDAFEKMLQEKYGFDAEQASLIAASYQMFMVNEELEGLSRKEQMHKYFSAMAGLCINYSGGAKRWKLISDTMSTTEAIKYFESLGMTEQEAFDLMGALNFQHTEGDLLSKATDYNTQGFCSNKDCDRNCGYQYHITDSKYWKFDYGDAAEKNDFAHELVQYSTFSHDENWVHKGWNYLGILGKLEAMISYKGDIYSTRMEEADMKSDIDGVNLYHRFETSEDNILEIMVDYHNQVSSGTVNYAEEFLENLGDGSAEIGYQRLKEELDHVDIASQYLDPDHGGVKSILQDALWYSSLVSSGAALTGEETMEELLDMSNHTQTENSTTINNKKKEFLEYVYKEWKKKND